MSHVSQELVVLELLSGSAQGTHKPSPPGRETSQQAEVGSSAQWAEFQDMHFVQLKKPTAFEKAQSPSALSSTYRPPLPLARMLSPVHFMTTMSLLNELLPLVTQNKLENGGDQ